MNKIIRALEELQNDSSMEQSERMSRILCVLNELGENPESPISDTKTQELKNRLRILELQFFHNLSYADAVNCFLAEREGTDLHHQKGRANDETRFRIKQRDGNKCTECGSTVNLEIHHIVPRRLGGGNTDDNLVTLCKTCHAKTEKISRRMKRRVGLGSQTAAVTTETGHDSDKLSTV